MLSTWFLWCPSCLIGDWEIQQIILQNWHTTEADLSDQAHQRCENVRCCQQPSIHRPRLHGKAQQRSLNDLRVGDHPSPSRHGSGTNKSGQAPHDGRGPFPHTLSVNPTRPLDVLVLPKEFTSFFLPPLESELRPNKKPKTPS